jgi:hypothetical protein
VRVTPDPDVRGGYLLALALAGQQPTRSHPFRSLGELERYVAQGQVLGMPHPEWWNVDTEDDA